MDSDKSILKNIVDWNQNRLYYSDNRSSKNLKKLSLVESLFS